ncbi:MAG: hypothetical protein IKK57_12050 [Clostridia bacterium]|nr:hypothetical protein [Clostridia bacterium]
MKKMLAMLLAVMLLAAPLSGLAEAADYSVGAALEAGRRVNWTVSVGDVAADMTGEPAVDQVIADVLNALVISGYMQGDEMYYAIGMKQDTGAVADLLNVGAAVVGDDVYLLSNLIGGTIVVSGEEVVPLLQRLVDMFVLLGFIPETEAESVKALIPEYWQLFLDEFNASMTAGNLMNDLDVTALNYNALLEQVGIVAGKMTQGEPDPLPRNCDPAVAMVTCTMTPEEMNALIASLVQFIKDNPDLADVIATEMDYDNTIAPEMSSVAGENVDFMGFLDMMMDEIRQSEIYEGDVVMRIWLGEDGMPVAMNTVVMKDGVVNEDSVSLDYHRLTMNSTVAHSVTMAFPEGDITLDVVVGEKNVMANFAVAEAGETRILVQVDYTDRSEGELKAYDVAVDVTITEATVSMEGTVNTLTDVYNAQQTVENTTINLHFDYSYDAVSSGMDFTCKDSLTIEVDGKEYLTILGQMETTAPGASITEGTVVRPAALSDADFANWFVSAYTALFSWAQNALFTLPASVMNLMNTGF